MSRVDDSPQTGNAGCQRDNATSASKAAGVTTAEVTTFARAAEAASAAHTGGGATAAGVTNVRGLSSMATRAVLAELAADYAAEAGGSIVIESVGGVDAARRIAAGEAFDVVMLASGAIDRLIEGGHVLPGSRVDLVRSPVAIAVRAGAPTPDVSTEAALREAVRAARSVGVSTGPSGTHLAGLFDRWGIAAEIRDRLVQPPPGVPVGSLVTRGEVELGFQQLSELMSLEGITVLGTLPPGADFITVFSGGVCRAAAQPAAARAWLEWAASPATAEAKRRHGMTPA
jgi:molybdate transport system substrate-binding protein